MKRNGFFLLCAAAALAVCSCYGLINLNYTPMDLVKASGQIVTLEVTGPVGDSAVKARVTGTLKGDAVSAKEYTFDLSSAPEEVIKDLRDTVGKARVAAILFVGNFSAASSAGAVADGEKKVYGALLANLKWFAVHRSGETLTLDKDAIDLNAVWAGTARRMVDAVKYAVEDANASFPVTIPGTWGGEQSLGKMGGEATGCLVADLKRTGQAIAIVLSDSGDRVFRRESAGMTNATAELKLATKSRQAVVVDIDGDGRLDLVSWNGKEVAVAAQGEDGAFAAPKILLTFDAKCHSLGVVASGKNRTARIVAGTQDGPVLLSADAQGKWTAASLAGASAKPELGKLGEGGCCVVGDTGDDGILDIVQFYSGGIACWTGETSGGFKSPVATAIPLRGLPSSAVAGDYDCDGLLDFAVSGGTGSAVLSRRFGETWNDMLGDTAELEYHGTLNDPAVVGMATCDVNRDGRQGVTLFYRTLSAKVFFNRGFACFGYGRSLDLGSCELAAAKAIGEGQQAGAMFDLNDDGAQDMFVVDASGGIRVLYGRAEGTRPVLQLSLPEDDGTPLTVRVMSGKRLLGMHVVQAGVPSVTGVERKGPLVLEWTDRSGVKQSRKEMVMGSKRIMLRP